MKVNKERNRLVGTPLIIYHGQCTDGFTAAWAAWTRFGDHAEYVPAQHGDAPPDVTEKSVYILDFGYPRETLLALKEKAHSLVVLDHHKSAQQDLAGLTGCFFDMARSGAGLAWDFFTSGSPRPLLVDFVEDYDLWRFADPRTESLSARLEVEPMEFDNWTRIRDELKSQSCVDTWMSEGRQLLALKEVLLRRAFSNKYAIELGGIAGLSCNAESWAASALGDRLAAASKTFGLVWHRTAHHIKCSLRSKGAVDVAELAAKFGGGGHARAAAFTLPLAAENLLLVAGSAPC